MPNLKQPHQNLKTNPSPFLTRIKLERKTLKPYKKSRTLLAASSTTSRTTWRKPTFTRALKPFLRCSTHHNRRQKGLRWRNNYRRVLQRLPLRSWRRGRERQWSWSLDGNQTLNETKLKSKCSTTWFKKTDIWKPSWSKTNPQPLTYKNCKVNLKPCKSRQS